MDDRINTVSAALDVLNTKLGGSTGDIPADATKVDALKTVYETLGGDPADVVDVSTTSQMIERLAGVAESGGSGGGGGGDGDFSVVTITNNYGQTLYVIGLNAEKGFEKEVENGQSVELVVGHVMANGSKVLGVPIILSETSISEYFTPVYSWKIDAESDGFLDTLFAFQSDSADGLIFAVCTENANLKIIQQSIG